MSIDRWIKRMWYVYKTEYYSAIQRNETMPFATACIDLEIKWSKSDRERQTPHDTTYPQNLKYDTKELICETVVNSQTQRADLWLPGGRDGLRFGIIRYKLLHIEWINNKVLLYITGNYIQYPMINHNGKEYEKKVRVCVCHFAVK